MLPIYRQDLIIDSIKFINIKVQIILTIKIKTQVILFTFLNIPLVLFSLIIKQKVYH